MTKDPNSSGGQAPKAINIIRPNTNYGQLLQNTTSTSSSGSVSSHNSLQQKNRNNSIHSTNSSVLSSSSGTRKPRVMSISHASEKPVLNIYHPPTKKSFNQQDSRSSSVVSSSNSNSSRPAIEIYKPNQQTKMTKSFTAPSLSASEHQQQQPIATTTRPISRSTHRSVLGPINTPVAATTLNNNATLYHSNNTTPTIEKTQAQLMHPHQLNTAIANIDINQDKSSSDSAIESEVEEEEEEEEVDSEVEEEEDSEVENSEEEEEEPVINEARVNRKIADLELSINSLLTVNAMLEATVRKQASQLNQFKSKMLSGESDSILLEDPSSLLNSDHLDNNVDIEGSSSDGENEEEKWDQDLVFQRLRKITEYMIEQGQKSIDYEYKILGRVLSNYKPPEDEEEDDEDEDGEEDGDIGAEKEEESLLHTNTTTASQETNTASSIPSPSTTTTNNTNIPSTTPNNTTTSRVARLSRRKQQKK